MRSISSGCRADAIAGGQGQRLPVRGLFPSCQSLTQLWKQRRRSPRGGTPLGPAGSGLRGCSAGVLTHGWRIGRGLCGASDGRPTRGAHPGRAVRLRTVTSDQKDSPMSGVRRAGTRGWGLGVGGCKYGARRERQSDVRSPKSGVRSQKNSDERRAKPPAPEMPERGPLSSAGERGKGFGSAARPSGRNQNNENQHPSLVDDLCV
jgi:hypothetical protein